MKKLFYILVFIFGLLFTSCTQEVDVNILPGWPYVGYYQPYTVNGNGQYAIGGYVTGYAPMGFTRSMLHEGAGASYDNFALYVYTPDSTIMNPYHGVFSGNTWGYSEDVKYFDNFVSEYSFIGIIPQDVVQTYDQTTHAVTVEANAFAVENENMDGYTDTEEVLYATTVVPKAAYATGASLTFNHANVKVYLKFKSDDPNTQIIDYTPYNPGSPEVPATPGTQTEKTSKMFDELVAGNTVGWPYLVGTENSTYSGSSGTYMNYVGSNASTARITNARLAELMPLVNAQFIYTDADGNDISDVDWVKGEEKKNTVFLKFADGVDTEEFLAGNDAFWTNLTTEEKAAMQNWYNSGIRVARINQIAGGNYFVWGMLNNQMTVTVITGGTPYQPAVPATGKEGVIVLPASSVLGDGTDAVLETYPTKANLTVTVDNPLVWEATDFDNTFTFTKPDGALGTETVVSPTTWFTFPKVANEVENLGYTVKFSFIYKGVAVYDARVYIPASHVNWQEGKYYEYIINITGRGNGHDTPDSDPDAIDPVIENPENFEIIVNPVINPYTEGEIHEYTIN